MKLLQSYWRTVQNCRFRNKSLAVLLGAIALLFSSIQVYSQSCVVPPGGLANWWTAELNANDSAGTNNGTLVGGVTFSSGKVGQAFNLNGTNQYINLGNSPSLSPSGSFTIEGWINPRRDQANVIMGKWGNLGSYVNYRSYIFLMHQNLGLRFAVTDAANINNAPLHAFDTPDAVITTNAWNHVAAVYDKSTGARRIYVNGVKVAERTDPPMVVNNTPANVTIGARLASSTLSSEWFDGQIDEISLYSRALTGDEIQTLFVAGNAGKCLGTFPPSITAQPQNQSVNANSNATFAVVVAGTAPLAYQWRLNGVDLVGATDSILTVFNAQPANSGDYSVVITNAYGSIISSNASLVVNGVAPLITSGPQSLTVNAGLNANFSVSANGTAPFAYQWLFDGNSLSGATRSSLTITNAQPVNAGSYAVVVTNAYGTVTSSNAFLIVNTFPPVVTNQPQSRTVNAGASTSFMVAAVGSPTLKYQWYFNGQAISGATNTLFAIGNVQPANEGLYHAVVTNAYGSATSSAANLTVVTFPPTITAQPQSRTVDAGTNVTFVAAATGTGPLSYQWQFNGLNIAGAIGASLTLNNVQPGNAGSYSVVVTNLYGSATSSNASLIVNTYPPSIVIQPQSQMVKVGNTANLSVIANGTAPLSYQWLLNNNEIVSATNSSLSLSNFSTNNAGSYSVVIANPYGTITSSNASLTAYIPACTTPPANLVSWWSGDLTPADFMGLNNGVTNGVLYSQGKVGQAFDFSGAGTYIDVGTNSSLAPTGSLAIEGWIYPRQDQSNVILSRWGNDGHERSYVLLLHQNLGVRFGVTDLANAGNAALHAFDSPNNVLTVNAWNHVAAVYDQPTGTRRIYVNGVKVAERVDPPMSVNNTFTRVTIGARRVYPSVYSEHFIGMIDELSFYSRALSGEEIQAIYQADDLGKCKSGIPAYLTAQPQPQIVDVGENAMFSVGAGGNAPLSYQWFFNGAALSAATNASLSIGNAQLTDGGSYQVVVANQYGSATSAVATLTVNVVAPEITTQPQSLTRMVGTVANFQVVATGSLPLSYQWLKDGGNLLDGGDISGASTASLTLSNVQAVAAGGYSVVVANSAGSITSTVATLSITLPPTAIQILSSTSSLGTVTVPINMISQGNENAVGFSVSFNPSMLALTSVNAGSGISGGSLIYNTNQLASGRLGVAISLPSGTTFAQGTRQLTQITFAVSAVTNTTTTPVSFTDAPTARQVSDAFAETLAATYGNGEVVIPFVGFEGDVTVRPDGDRKLTVTDWVQLGRFVAGLDTITNSSEFQRADCAPRSALGNGRLTVSDWVQAGRYSVGADPVTSAGGPTEEQNPGNRTARRDSAAEETSVREIRIPNISVQSGQTIVLPVLLDSQGNENAIGFSLGFDPSILALKGVSLGSNAANATLNVNTNFEGKVGCVLALPTGNTFAASIQEIVQVTFLVVGNANTNVTFINSPVVREVSDVTANVLSASYADAMVAVTGPGTINPPSLGVRKSGDNIVLFWPASASGFLLEASDNLDLSSWTELSGASTTNELEVQVTVPVSDARKFYRLHQP